MGPCKMYFVELSIVFCPYLKGSTIEVLLYIIIVLMISTYLIIPIKCL